MNVKYINCSGLDSVGSVGTHGFYRLTFTNQNVLLPDSYLQGDFAGNAQEQLDRIGKTPVFYPIQGEPTIIDDPDSGAAAVIDVKARSTMGDIPLRSALSAVEDSYARCKLFSCEAVEEITDATVARRSAEQTAQALDAVNTVGVMSPGTIANSAGKAVSRVAMAGIVTGFVILIVAVVVIWKMPKA